MRLAICTLGDDYAQTDGATLEIVVGKGADSARRGLLWIDGDVRLDGHLRVQLETCPKLAVIPVMIFTGKRHGKFDDLEVASQDPAATCSYEFSPGQRAGERARRHRAGRAIRAHPSSDRELASRASPTALRQLRRPAFRRAGTTAIIAIIANARSSARKTSRSSSRSPATQRSAFSFEATIDLS